MAEASGDDVFDTAAFDCGTFEAVSEMEHHYEMEHLKETNSLEEYELFTNGLGLNLQQEERFDSVIETRKHRKKFHEGGTWVPTTDFSALPYLWVKPRHGHPHHFADVVQVNKVISIELGYDHVIDYIETRGWTITRKSRNQPGYTLQYRKLEAAIAAWPSDKQSATKTRNLHAMVEDLFCWTQLLLGRTTMTVWSRLLAAFLTWRTSGSGYCMASYATRTCWMLLMSTEYSRGFPSRWSNSRRKC
jgi:hypothetical protein